MSVLSVMRNVIKTALQGEERSSMRADMNAAHDEIAELLAEGWNMVASSRHTGKPIDTERLAAALARFHNFDRMHGG